MSDNTRKAHQPPVALPPPLAVKREMSGRDIHEMNRASTPLELLFDLTVVVAVAAAASRLHHSLVETSVREAGLEFVQSFFAIWWPWMSYTWFASAYDTDDVPFRMATLLQMLGVLLIAVGIPHGASADAAGVVGFFLMRATLFAQWWRASLEHPERRATCRRYAMAIGVLQVLWLARAVWLPADWQFPTFCVLAALELVVPVWAARAGETPWHAHHVAERYGLFTIILLGECMVASANTIAGVLATRGWSLDLGLAAISIVGLILSLWWAYFLVPFAQVLHQRRERGFIWGYGHALVFGALAALGGVLEVVADALKGIETHAPREAIAHETASPNFAIGLAAATVVGFIAALWWLGAQTTQRDARNPKYVLPVLLASLAGWACVVSGIPLAWGLLMVTAGPALLIVWVTHDRQQRPERFAVR